MHIPEAVLSPPVTLVTGAIAVGGFAFGLKRLEQRDRSRATVLMGMTAAFIFAAQMVNFPLGVVPASGHLLGGVLAAVLLGPWAASVVIGAVLIVQCLLFQDGGVLALGANYVNLGLVGSVGGYAIYEPIRRRIGGRAGVLIGAMIGAWFSVLLASGAFAVEFAASGRRDVFLSVLSWMALVHAAIGLGEALITGLVLKSVLAVRPDLIFESEAPAKGSENWYRTALGGLAIAIAVAIFLAPWASPLDDGLEFVGTRLGLLAEEGPRLVASPMPDYQFRGLPDIPLVTAIAGLIGTLTVFGSAALMARSFAGRGVVTAKSSSTEGSGSHAG